jgi:hypothetical protein
MQNNINRGRKKARGQNCENLMILRVHRRRKTDTHHPLPITPPNQRRLTIETG